MKTILYYEANDGKRFESEEECLDYELEKDIEPIKDHLYLWNGDGEMMALTPHTDLDNAWAIYCSSISAAKFLKVWGERDGVTNPYEKIDIENNNEVPLGEFVWFNGDWVQISEIIAYYQTMSRNMANGNLQIELLEP